jgi:hypothetical protein
MELAIVAHRLISCPFFDVTRRMSQNNSHRFVHFMSMRIQVNTLDRVCFRLIHTPFFPNGFDYFLCDIILVN